MSDAPTAAPATESGVPTTTQEKIVEEVPGHKVFIGNLAYTTTEEGLKAFFAPVQGEITSAQIILRGTRSAGYAFVAFANEAAAAKAAAELNGKELDGRAVQVELAKNPADKEKKPRTKKPKSRRGDSKAPPGEVTEAEANGDAAAPTDGAAPATDEAAKPKKKKKAAKKPKKKAVDGEAAPADGEAAPVAAEGDAAATETKKPKAKKPKTPRPPRRAPGEDPAGEPSKNMLFVANLGFALDDEGLQALFKEAGIETKSVHVVRRRWGNPRKSKGYGFVDVVDEAGQQKGVAALNGKEVGGRPIAVKVAIDAVVKEAQAAEAAIASETAPEATVVAA